MILIAACSSHPHPHPVGTPTPKGSATPVEVEPDAGAPDASDVNASGEVPTGPIDTGGERAGETVSGTVKVAAPPSIDGSLDPDGVLRAIQSRTAMVRRCYKAALAKTPQLAGAINVQLDVLKDGSIGAAIVKGLDADLDTCIEGAFDTLRLPAPSDGHDAEAKFRITLAAS